MLNRTKIELYNNNRASMPDNHNAEAGCSTCKHFLKDMKDKFYCTRVETCKHVEQFRYYKRNSR